MHWKKDPFNQGRYTQPKQGHGRGNQGFRPPLRPRNSEKHKHMFWTLDIYMDKWSEGCESSENPARRASKEPRRVYIAYTRHFNTLVMGLGSFTYMQESNRDIKRGEFSMMEERLLRFSTVRGAKERKDCREKIERDEPGERNVQTWFPVINLP